MPELLDLLAAPAFHIGGAPASWLELIAAVLALAMVACNMREIHWGWPLAMLSSLLYVGVFAAHRIYGDASLQVFFAVMAAWGWFQWLRGHRADGSSLQVARLSARGWLAIGLNNAEPDTTLVTEKNLVGIIKHAFVADNTVFRPDVAAQLALPRGATVALLH